MLKCSHTGPTMGTHGDGNETESYSPGEEAAAKRGLS